MSKELKEYVNRHLKIWKERGEWENYSAEVLTFSCLLGLPPEECTGMYVESDWEPEQVEEYDEITDYLYALKRKEN